MISNSILHNLNNNRYYCHHSNGENGFRFEKLINVFNTCSKQMGKSDIIILQLPVKAVVSQQHNMTQFEKVENS